MRSIPWCGTSATRTSSSAMCPPSAASPAASGRSLGSPALTVSTLLSPLQALGSPPQPVPLSTSQDQDPCPRGREGLKVTPKPLNTKKIQSKVVKPLAAFLRPQEGNLEEKG